MQQVKRNMLFITTMRDLEGYIVHVYTELDGLFSLNDLQAFLGIGYKKACDIMYDLEKIGICKLTTRGRFASVSLDRALLLFTVTND